MLWTTVAPAVTPALCGLALHREHHLGKGPVNREETGDNGSGIWSVTYAVEQ